MREDIQSAYGFSKAVLMFRPNTPLYLPIPWPDDDVSVGEVEVLLVPLPAQTLPPATS